MDALFLGLASLATSTVAGVLGLGGGMLLISVVPIFVPAAAIIPVHGTAQLASNASRGLFAFRSIAWGLLPRFLLGSAIGIGLITAFLWSIPLDYIPLAIAAYILSRLWLPNWSKALEHYENMVIVGALQTGLGLIVGATGPLTTTILSKRYPDKDIVVATNALFMSLSHLAKLLVYGVLGFVFVDFWLEILALVVGAVTGSFIGTKLRSRVDNQRFFVWLKIVLTLLALRMIVLTFLP